MLGKIILVQAPPQMVRGWSGRLIFRKTGFLIRLYKVKKVIGTKVLFHAEKAMNVPDEECYKADLYDKSFFQPVVFMPQAEEEENRFQELHYSCWSKSKYHIATQRMSLQVSNYKTHYVHIKHVREDGARIGARSPIQRYDRSWPKVSLNVGW